MDSVTLRKTHFLLGDYRNPYSTSAMDQNKLIEYGKKEPSAALDSKIKADLRASHFIMGNFNPNYNTMHKTEFYDKSSIPNIGKNQSNIIGSTLRKHNYVLGDDSTNYLSEMQSRYNNPIGGVKRYYYIWLIILLFDI